MTSVKPYFKELAYLESTGTQYFNTGVYGNNNTKVEISFYNPTDFTISKPGSILFGARDTTTLATANSFTIIANMLNNTKMRYDYKDDNRPGTNLTIGKHVIVKDKENNYLDGELINSNPTTTFAGSYPLFLLACNTGSTATLPFVGKLYYCKIWDNDVLVRDFIPVLDNNKKPALYDKVTEALYYNAGTGEFTYAFKDYKCELAYLESTGTQYIDTLWSPQSNNLRVKFKVKSKGTPRSTAICGAENSSIVPRWVFVMFGQAADSTKTFPLIGDWKNGGTGFTAEGFTFTDGTILDIDWTTSSTSTTITDSISNITYTHTFDTTITYSNNTTTLKLFQNNDAQKSSIDMYYYQIYDNDTLVRDFIPVLDWNDRPCLYDKANNEFYYNQGTEEFKYACKDFQYKLEYIESAGTQYIDLEYIPKTNTITKLSCDYTYSGICYLFGATSNDYRTNVYSFSGNHQASDGYFRTFVAGDTQIPSQQGNTGNSSVHNSDNLKSIEFTNTYVTLDGTQYVYTYPTTQALNIQHSMFLFARNTKGTADNFTIMKVYSLQVYEGDTLIRDMIPVMDWTGKPCLYDKITKRCYYNAGSGEFNYKYADYIAELGYLESDGNQYIDIGYVVGQRTDIEIEFMNLSNTPNIFGAKTSWSSKAYSLNSNAGYFCFNFGNNSSATTLTTTIPVDTTKWHVAKIETRSGGATGIVDNSSLPNLGNYAFTTEKNMILFGNNNADGTMNLAPSRISYCKIGWAGTTNTYFIPVLDPEGRPAMWNKLRNQLHYNQGTGEFRYGYKQPEYTELSYIESTGTQYIDTGYIPTSNTSFELSGVDMDYHAGTTRFGSRLDQKQENYCFTVINGDVFRFSYGTSQTTAGLQYMFNTQKLAKQVSYDASTKICTITFNDGTTESSPAFTSTPLTSNTKSLYMFAFNDNGTPVLGTSKVSELRIFEGNTLVRDMIPVLDKDNIPCMYDKVEGKYYYNQGTGQFKYGQKGYYCEVEYLESTGTQYIDTGINADSDLGIEYTYLTPTLTNEALRFGAIWTDGSSIRRHHTSYVNSYLANGYYIGKSNYIAVCNTDTTGIHTYKLDVTTQKSYLDGVECTMHSQTTYEPFDCEMNYWLFGRNCNDTSLINYASLRIYNFKMYNRDILVRDFIPVLDMNMRPCMYDKVEGKCYYNIGTGEFNYGRKIYPVEYLESSGTQYVVSPLVFSGDNYRIECKYDKKSLAQTSMFCYQKTGSNGQQIMCIDYAPQDEYKGDLFWHGSTDSTGNENRRKLNVFDIGLNEVVIEAKNNILAYNVNGRTDSYAVVSSFEPTAESGMWIFGNNREAASGGHQEATAKFYYFRTYQNNELVVDMIPAIDENGIGFVFDRITHACYLNEGTGQFTYGSLLYNNGISSIMSLKKKEMLISYHKKNNYTPLKYLQSSGTQYIDLGVKANLNTRTEIAFCYPSASNVSGSGRVFGSREDSVTNAFGIGSYSGTVEQGTKITDYFSNSNTSPTTTVTIDIGKWYITYISKDLITNDGIIEALSESPTEFTTPSTLKLFGFDNNGTMTCGIVRIASCRIIQNNELIRDMVPVLDDFGVPCMWDRVQDRCYYNKGAGDFTYEAWDYTPVDYLTTSGSSYSNTFLYGNSDTKMEMVFEIPTQSTQNRGSMGSRGNSANNQLLAIGYGTAKLASDFNNSSYNTYRADLNYDLNTKYRVYTSKEKRSIIDEATGTVLAENNTLCTDNMSTSVLLLGAETGLSYRHIGKIYSAKMWNGNVLIRNYIPVVDENSKAGFYDKCLNIIFYNIGSADWIVPA